VRVVLIIADDPEFARTLVARWQAGRSTPELTVMSTELLSGALDAEFDMAVVGPLRTGRLEPVLKLVDRGAQPVISVVESSAQLASVRSNHPRVLAVLHQEALLDSLLVLAEECLRRVDLAERVRKAEQAAHSNANNAALGRYMLETRHDFNNSLTSVLGNAELLMIDGDTLPPLVRDQVETIHTMALHMHDVMQRFASMASEIQRDEKKSQDETRRLSHAAVGGD
jgi:signal transduction histidine kinase